MSDKKEKCWLLMKSNENAHEQTIWEIAVRNHHMGVTDDDDILIKLVADLPTFTQNVFV